MLKSGSEVNLCLQLEKTGAKLLTKEKYEKVCIVCIWCGRASGDA